MSDKRKAFEEKLDAPPINELNAQVDLLKAKADKTKAEVSTVCRRNDNLSDYDIYYINHRRGIISPKVVLLQKKGLQRVGVLEFIFSHAWNG